MNEKRKGFKKSKKVVPKMKSDPKKIGSTIKADHPNDAFDFGGIPERNLKKNLGCG